MPSGFDANSALRASMNDYAVNSGVGGRPRMHALGGVNERELARRKKWMESGVSPEMVETMERDFTNNAGRQLEIPPGEVGPSVSFETSKSQARTGGGYYGPGFQRYRAQAAADALAAGQEWDPRRWGMPAGYSP